MHFWLASGDQEEQVSRADRHISSGRFAALSGEESAFTTPFERSPVTVAQEVSNSAPATSTEIEVKVSRLVFKGIRSSMLI